MRPSHCNVKGSNHPKSSWMQAYSFFLSVLRCLLPIQYLWLHMTLPQSAICGSNFSSEEINSLKISRMCVKATADDLLLTYACCCMSPKYSKSKSKENTNPNQNEIKIQRISKLNPQEIQIQRQSKSK